MAGHSKWANIKRRKEAQDKKRAKLFNRLLREISVAARLGGDDPDYNARLSSAIDEAKSNNVPNDNIERAILKGIGELDGGSYEEVTYEGYGPGGVAMFIDASTDNRNRTVADIRYIFDQHDASLGEDGCVSWMFDRRGYFAVVPDGMSEEEFVELALEVGGDDVTLAGEVYELYTAVDEYARIRDELKTRDLELTEKALAMIPQSRLRVDDETEAAVAQLIEALEDHDDVQHVWTNADPDPAALPEAS